MGYACALYACEDTLCGIFAGHLGDLREVFSDDLFDVVDLCFEVFAGLHEVGDDFASVAYGAVVFVS